MTDEELDYKLYSAKDLKTGENKLIKVPISKEAYFKEWKKQLQDTLKPMIEDALLDLEKEIDKTEKEIRMIDLKIVFLLLFPVFLLIMGILFQGG